MQSSRILPFSLVRSTVALVGACGGGGNKGTGGWRHRRGRTGNVVATSCGDATAAPWTASGTPAVTLAVDGATTGAAWSRFYEGAVATDHANTILSSAWGRNAQNGAEEGRTTWPASATRASTES